MKILELNNPDLITTFLVKAGSLYGAEFLASLEWKNLFPEFKNFGIFSDDEELLAVVNVKRQEIKLGIFYYYSPRGPIILKEVPELWNFLANYFKRSGAAFWRVEPVALPSNFSFKKTIDLQPRQSLILDLSKNENQLLQEMHHKTRYNIRLAEKKNLRVVEGETKKDFDDFWSLMQKTGDRDGFRIHNEKHYEKLAQANPTFIKLFLVKQEDKILAAGLFSFYGNKVTYLHGASDNDNRQLMAPYLLQWELIKIAKERDYKYYDFFGIDEHKWPGVTRFKLGFGGYKVEYVGTNDLVFKPLAYHLYSLLRKIRRSL